MLKRRDRARWWVVDAVDDDSAARHRRVDDGALAALHNHSDRGTQYASEPFQGLMSDHGVSCSMSREGNVWNNAAT